MKRKKLQMIDSYDTIALCFDNKPNHATVWPIKDFSQTIISGTAIFPLAARGMWTV